MQPQLSIIIPNWNGETIISRCLAGTLEAARTCNLSAEIIVVDDASKDAGAQIIQREFPSVRLIQNPENLGFGGTVNRGAEASSGKYLIILNNDLVPKPGMFSELAGPLESDPQVFGVSARTLDWKDGNPNHLDMAGRWQATGLRLTYRDSKKTGSTMFLQGGSCAMRRDDFLRFGGFSHLYSPGYWEDYDISFLALKAGMRNLYNPAALALHLGRGSMTRAYSSDRLAAIQSRNRHLFHLAALSDPAFLRQYILSLPRQVAFDSQPRLQSRWAAIQEAAGCAEALTALRKQRQPLWVRSDSDIFREFQNHGVPA